jgi:hypothetical protein
MADVLQLADISESFRDVCIKNYKLDPLWYYTAPGLAWDACLKLTGIKLELPKEIDMVLLIKSGIRGGISSIMHRYAKANNKYMSDYDAKVQSTFIKYLDANNLYGWAMCLPLGLSTGNFKWMTEHEIRTWRSTPCLLEVDLEYPEELHDLHNDYPLAPESLIINKCKKLVPNLRNKTKYVVHHVNLKLYERLGMKITKIHRGLSFDESDWMGKYIQLNTRLRTAATNEFEKDFFKLLNNAVFGKTMQDVAKHIDVRLVSDPVAYMRLVAQPNFDRSVKFDEKLVAVHMKKTKVLYNKPIYLGMCILELSKTLMYEFHYDYIKPKYGDKARLLMTDTDSLVYEIETGDFYADTKCDIQARFDTSDYPRDHPATAVGFTVGANKKILGMLKDETAGAEIGEFAGLRAKCYALRVQRAGMKVDFTESSYTRAPYNEQSPQGRMPALITSVTKYIGGMLRSFVKDTRSNVVCEEIRKAKGIKKSVVAREILLQDYKDVLFTGRPQYRKMNMIRSELHDVYTITVNKKALSADDDKRVIMDDG